MTHRCHRFVMIAITVLFACAPASAQQKLTIASDRVEVDVAADAPRILEYRLKANGGRILGSLGQGAPAVIVAPRGGQRQTVEWAALMPQVRTAPDALVYSCTARIGNTVAATFDWAIRVSGNTVTIAAENVRETDGYDLNEFVIPADPIVRVSGDLPGARACVGDLLGESWRGRGSPAEPGRIALPGESLNREYHFGLVFTNQVAAGVYSNSLHRMGSKPIQTAVSTGSTGLYTNHHRYSYQDENYEPYWCKVGIVGDVNGDGATDWKDAACFIHDAIPKRVKLRQDAMKYMMNHGADFEHAPEDVFRKICNLSDGHPQMVLLSGWNSWGWDSEYPTWDDPGEEYSGRPGLYVLHENAHKYRAYTSMIYNFDDAYKRTRGWDESIISRNKDGSLIEATWWSGGPSYIVSFYRLWKSGRARQVIDDLVAQGAERQMFSDVFTILPFRPDYGPGGAGDEETNLVMGKFKILDYLAQNDIYMNSEGFNYEMLGRYIGAHNGFNTGLTRDPNRPPLAMFICAGLLTKQYLGGRGGDEARFRAANTEVGSPWEPDQVYRHAMLISFYGEKPMRDFRVTPEGYFARYGDDVEVVWRQQGGAAPADQPAAGARGARGRGGAGGGGANVTVRLAGRLISDGPSVLLPKPDLGANMWNVLRAYSSTGAPMRYPKPANWTDLSALTVMALTTDNPPTPVPNDGKVAFEGNELLINIPANRPFKLVYGQELVARERTFEPLPPRRPITYPLEEVISREGGDTRPDWIRLRTRKPIGEPTQIQPLVGCSSIWPTKEAATEHAAAVISKKIAWFVRQTYVDRRTRPYERDLGANFDNVGYENWYLGHDAAVKMYTVASINARPGTQWYWEQVRYGPNRAIGWKAFVCIPFTAKDGQDVYIEAARMRLAECQQGLAANPTGARRSQLEMGVKLYQHMVSEESKKEPLPLGNRLTVRLGSAS